MFFQIKMVLEIGMNIEEGVYFLTTNDFSQV